jgi:hypothetical protein
MLFDATSHAALHRAFGKRTAALLMMGVALSLVGCTRQPEPPRHTVAEYRADPALRREQFARCSNDPGALGSTPDCLNARQAMLLEDSHSVRDLPPIRLPPPPNESLAHPRE